MSVFSLHRVGVAGAVAAALFSVAGVASASNFYFQADVSSDRADIKASELAPVFDDESFDIDSADFDKGNSGLTLAVGYQITKNVAVEVAWMDLGNTQYEATGTFDDGESGSLDATFGIGFRSKGPALSVVGTWPIGMSFSVDARLGAYRGETTEFLTISDETGGITGDILSGKKTGMLAGVGGTWTLSEHVGLHLGYTMVKDAMADRDVNRIGLGIRVTF